MIAKNKVIKTKTAPRTARKKAPTTVLGVVISHPDKEVYPEIHLTKGELAEYYAKVSEIMLPEIQQRPLSLVRCPAGHTSCFFQKHLGPESNETIPSVTTGGGEFVPYIKDEKDIVELMQLNVIEFHQWGSGTNNIEIPTRMIIDLDPGEGVKEADIIAGGMLVRELLIADKLTSYARVTGGHGLHVVVPLTGKNCWDEVKEYAKAISDKLAQDSPEKFVRVATKAKRAGKIYVDYLRNGRGATSVSNYSARAREGAPVAVPIEWADLKGAKKLPRYTVGDAARLVTLAKKSSWKKIDSVKQSLPKSK